MLSRFTVVSALALALTLAPSAMGAEPKKPTKSRPSLLERAGKPPAEDEKKDAGATDRTKERTHRDLERAKQRRDEAAARKRAREASTDVRDLVKGVRGAPSGPNAPRETPDARSLREQNRDRFPIAPPQAKPSPFERTDPAKARSEAWRKARERATHGLREETIEVPDPMDRTLPRGRAGIPGTGGSDVNGLKGITSRVPGGGERTNPYDGASLARHRPFFRLQHQGGGEGVWRCVKHCGENGFVEGELTDTQGLPDNAVRDDVSDMTTTEKLCKENPKLCEEAGRSDRRPNESDAEYWDRKAKEAHQAHKERDRARTQAQAEADCSKQKSRTDRESCEFDKKLAQQEVERRRKEEERRKKAEHDQKKADDCAVAAGEDCDGLPDDALVDWHRATQERLLGATGAGRNTGSGNVDPTRGPSWNEGLEERAVEVLGVADPPEDEAVADGAPPPGADCATQPGSGAIDYGPDHPASGNPACQTDVPQFDSREPLDLGAAGKGGAESKQDGVEKDRPEEDTK